ncbi:ATP-binding protein [Streptomyces sp. NPDC058067]|uniref:ATP-binding protein n=1 Tax=Streptomyces sp. NPDC058067 TaxID=3346324 RepID=UPI0036E6810A
MKADLIETQQRTVHGVGVMIRMRSGTCEVDVALTARSVSGMRDLVSACLTLWGLDDLDMRVTLAASELLTNAFQHARKAGEDAVPVKVVLTRTPDGVFLSVSDPSPRHPTPVTASDTDEGGRGLALVAEISNGYGCSSTAHGKDVWVTVLRPS